MRSLARMGQSERILMEMVPTVLYVPVKAQRMHFAKLGLCMPDNMYRRNPYFAQLVLEPFNVAHERNFAFRHWPIRMECKHDRHFSPQRSTPSTPCGGHYLGIVSMPSRTATLLCSKYKRKHPRDPWRISRVFLVLFKHSQTHHGIPRF
jgi:hypothetical protein